MDRLRQTLRVAKERAILVAAHLPRASDTDDLAELAALAGSAGAVVVDRFQQKIRKINASTYLGKGKAEELARKVKKLNADVIIFDNNLSPAQIRDLEEITQTKVLDRSELILDIFATRAKTRQAQLQVDLAQLEYIYPRLTRMWSHLDSVAGAGGATAAGTVGAIGTRGTGEQQLEIDRRLVEKRISELKHQLVEIDKRRIREIDGRRGVFKICLVGYTNAGKSTLLNTLTDAGVLVEDRLFSTLDTRTRKWSPARGVEVLLSDTVGFVRNLPHQLVASFKATLEETVNADLLIHVIDASNADALKQIDSVNAVLADIGCGKHPVLKVLNKVDAVGKLGLLETLQILYPDAVTISAKTGLGIDVLAQAVVKIYMGEQINIRLTCPQSNGKIQSFLRTHARITKEDYSDSEVIIEATIGNSRLLPLKSLSPTSLEIL